MKLNLKHGVRVIAVAGAFGIGGAVVQAVSAPFFQGHEQDYSKNKTCQQGMRDGKGDRAHNRDHSKKRHFKKDDDKQAYEAGYQKARGN